MHPSVFIILVNWNRAGDTLQCIASLTASTYSNTHIVVVDNGSSDDSLAHLRHVADQITVLEAGDNLGFTGGNNVGIVHACSHDADYIFLLNNDTLVSPTAIEQLVGVLEADDRIGV